MELLPIDAMFVTLGAIVIGLALAAFLEPHP